MIEEKRHIIKLIITIIVTTAFFGVEIVFGHITKSLALIGDSYNMLSNIMSMVLGLICIKLTSRESKKSTFGWARAEITGALINAVFLVALCFSILTGSIQRLVITEEIEQPMTLFIVGTVGLVVNLFGMILFFNETFAICLKKKDEEIGEDLHDEVDRCYGGSTNPSCASYPHIQDEVHVEIDDDDLETFWRKEKTKKMKSGSQMNIQGVFLHIMGDALGSVVVVVSALVVMNFEGEWRYKVDPGLSIIMVIIIVATTMPLIKQTSFILLQHLPGHMVVPEMLQEMYRKVRGLEGVHEFHIWQLVGSRMIASLHIKSNNLTDYKVVSRRLKSFFHNNGIHTVTIQPDFAYPENGLRNGNLNSLTSSCPEGTCCSMDSCTHLSSPVLATPLGKIQLDNDAFVSDDKTVIDDLSTKNIFSITQPLTEHIMYNIENIDNNNNNDSNNSYTNHPRSFEKF